MVRYATILKVITDHTTKNDHYTGMSAPLPNKVKGQINRFAEDLKTFSEEDRKIEHGRIITPEGRLIAEVRGSEDKIGIGLWSIPIEERRKVIDNNTSMHSVHTHPSGMDTGLPTILSKQDVLALCHAQVGFKTENGKLVEFKPLWTSTTAISTNGSRMTLTITDLDKWTEKGRIRLKNRFTSNPLIRKYKKLENSYYNFIDDCEDYANAQMGLKLEDEIRKNPTVDPTILKDNIKNRAKKEYSKKLMKDYLAEDIEGFKELGLDLSIGWYE